jgi:primary-amine oxidase
MQGLIFARDTRTNNPDSNHYAYPIPLIPVMEWATKKIVRVDRLPTGGSEDGHEPAVRSDKPKQLFAKSVPAEYAPELLEIPARDDLKPLNVVQPEGASFNVHPDGLIEWQKWRFRISVSPREGAVLHDVCYDNRSVLYRLSYSELTVPYGDPRSPYHRKQAFDFGDGGIGRAANSLKLGCDCLGAIHYLDGNFSDPDGSPNKLESVVCLHEQDSGILWKHTNFRTDRGVVARMREFVVQFIGTLANYEYIFSFKLDQAGGITVETRATGMVSVVTIDEGKTSKYGNIVSPGILAQNHQHIFAVRIDPAIDLFGGDGKQQTQVVVEESHRQKMDPKTNPFGNYYEVRRNPVQKATWVDAEPRLNRVLKFENSSKKNAISGKSVGYKLISPATQMLLADEESRVAKRAQFAQHNFWVTGHRDGEFWAAGEFTNQSTFEEGGVSDMVKRGDWFATDVTSEANGNGAANGDGSGKQSDPVVWSVFGLTHNPRVEDWPVM